MRARDTIKRLRRRYNLCKGDRKKIKKIRDFQITSIAYTAYGGFDSHTGDHYLQDKEVNYKLRIRYRRPRKVTDEFLLLMPD